MSSETKYSNDDLELREFLPLFEVHQFERKDRILGILIESLCAGQLMAYEITPIYKTENPLSLKLKKYYSMSRTALMKLLSLPQIEENKAALKPKLKYYHIQMLIRDKQSPFKNFAYLNSNGTYEIEQNIVEFMGQSICPYFIHLDLPQVNLDSHFLWSSFPEALAPKFNVLWQSPDSSLEVYAPNIYKKITGLGPNEMPKVINLIDGSEMPPESQKQAELALESIVSFMQNSFNK